MADTCSVPCGWAPSFVRRDKGYEYNMPAMFRVFRGVKRDEVQATSETGECGSKAI